MQKLLTEHDVAAILQCKPHAVRRLPLEHLFLSANGKRGKRYTMAGVQRFQEKRACQCPNDVTGDPRSISMNLKSKASASGAAPGARPNAKRSRSSGKSASKQSSKSHWSDWTPAAPRSSKSSNATG